MAERITLRAKSDGTEISGKLLQTRSGYWYVQLAPRVPGHVFYSDEWERVSALPTTPGCVFRATVCGVENVRVVLFQGPEYGSAVSVGGSHWHLPEQIDPATVVIELEGEVE